MAEPITANAPEPAECPRHPGNDRDTCPPCSDRRRRWAPEPAEPDPFAISPLGHDPWG